MKSEELIVKMCAPTLAGLKTGSMFSASYRSEAKVKAELRRLNGLFEPKGLVIMPLRFADNTVLLYVGRMQALARDLTDPKAAAMLKKLGYPCGSTKNCLLHLMRRMRTLNGFPHEVGLFLGYPPEDVLGFVRNRAKNYKAVGLWKVYGDTQMAQRQFEACRKCTEESVSRFKSGASLEQLIM